MAYNRDLMLRMVGDIEAFAIAGAAQLAADVVEITTKGDGAAPPAAIDTGELRASVRVTVNQPSSERSERGKSSYRNPTAAAARRAVQLGGFALGDVLWEKWIAKHANIIEKGRTTDKNGRPIGSDQNPEGFLWLARDEALSRMDRWRYKGGRGRAA